MPSRNPDTMFNARVLQVLRNLGLTKSVADSSNQIKALSAGNAVASTGGLVAAEELATDVTGTYIRVDGTVAFTGDQAMGGNQLTGLGAPSADDDACTKGYADASSQTYFCAHELYGSGTSTTYLTLHVISGVINYNAGVNVVIPTLAGSGNVTFKLWAFVDGADAAKQTSMKWSAEPTASGTDWAATSAATLTSVAVNAASTTCAYVFVHTVARTSLVAGELLSLMILCTGIKIVGLEIVW
jgi:hypothetical protein